MPKISLREFEDPRVTWVEINKFLYKEIRKILFPKRISFPEFVNFLVYLSVNRDPRMNSVYDEIIQNRNSIDYTDKISGLDEEGIYLAIKKLREEKKKGMILPGAFQDMENGEQSETEGMERIKIEDE